MCRWLVGLSSAWEAWASAATKPATGKLKRTERSFGWVKTVGGQRDMLQRHGEGALESPSYSRYIDAEKDAVQSNNSLRHAAKAARPQSNRRRTYLISGPSHSTAH
jgi:hypothetical protein